jgi:hypothetical protein
MIVWELLFAPHGAFFVLTDQSMGPIERSQQNEFIASVDRFFPENLFLRPDEGEEVRVDLVCVGGGHPVRQAGIGFQSSVLQEFD